VLRSLKHWIKTLSESAIGTNRALGRRPRGHDPTRRAHPCNIPSESCDHDCSRLSGGSFRDFAGSLADSRLLQWFCRVGQLDRARFRPKASCKLYDLAAQEEMREVISGLCSANPAQGRVLAAGSASSRPSRAVPTIAHRGSPVNA